MAEPRSVVLDLKSLDLEHLPCDIHTYFSPDAFAMPKNSYELGTSKELEKLPEKIKRLYGEDPVWGYKEAKEKKAEEKKKPEDKLVVVNPEKYKKQFDKLMDALKTWGQEHKIDVEEQKAEEKKQEDDDEEEVYEHVPILDNYDVCKNNFFHPEYATKQRPEYFVQSKQNVETFWFLLTEVKSISLEKKKREYRYFTKNINSCSSGLGGHSGDAVLQLIEDHSIEYVLLKWRKDLIDQYADAFVVLNQVQAGVPVHVNLTFYIHANNMKWPSFPNIETINEYLGQEFTRVDHYAIVNFDEYFRGSCTPIKLVNHISDHLVSGVRSARNICPLKEEKEGWIPYNQDFYDKTKPLVTGLGLNWDDLFEKSEDYLRIRYNPDTFEQHFLKHCRDHKKIFMPFLWREHELPNFKGFKFYIFDTFNEIFYLQGPDNRIVDWKKLPASIDPRKLLSEIFQVAAANLVIKEENIDPEYKHVFSSKVEYAKFNNTKRLFYAIFVKTVKNLKFIIKTFEDLLYFLKNLGKNHYEFLDLMGSGVCFYIKNSRDLARCFSFLTTKTLTHKLGEALTKKEFLQSIIKSDQDLLDFLNGLHATEKWKAVSVLGNLEFNFLLATAERGDTEMLDKILTAIPLPSFLTLAKYLTKPDARGDTFVTIALKKNHHAFVDMCFEKLKIAEEFSDKDFGKSIDFYVKEKNHKKALELLILRPYSEIELETMYGLMFSGYFPVAFFTMQYDRFAANIYEQGLWFHTICKLAENKSYFCIDHMLNKSPFSEPQPNYGPGEEKVLNIIDKTLKILCADKEQKIVFKILLNFPFYLNKPDCLNTLVFENGQAILVVAIQYKNVKIIKLFLEKFADKIEFLDSMRVLDFINAHSEEKSASSVEYDELRAGVLRTFIYQKMYRQAEKLFSKNVLAKIAEPNVMFFKLIQAREFKLAYELLQQREDLTRMPMPVDEIGNTALILLGRETSEPIIIDIIQSLVRSPSVVGSVNKNKENLLTYAAIYKNNSLLDHILSEKKETVFDPLFADVIEVSHAMFYLLNRGDHERACLIFKKHTAGKRPDFVNQALFELIKNTNSGSAYFQAVCNCQFTMLLSFEKNVLHEAAKKYDKKILEYFFNLPELHKIFNLTQLEEVLRTLIETNQASEAIKLFTLIPNNLSRINTIVLSKMLLVLVQNADYEIVEKIMTQRKDVIQGASFLAALVSDEDAPFSLIKLSMRHNVHQVDADLLNLSLKNQRMDVLCEILDKHLFRYQEEQIKTFCLALQKSVDIDDEDKCAIFGKILIYALGHGKQSILDLFSKADLNKTFIRLIRARQYDLALNLLQQKPDIITSQANTIYPYDKHPPKTLEYKQLIERSVKFLSIDVQDFHNGFVAALENDNFIYLNQCINKSVLNFSCFNDRRLLLSVLNKFIMASQYELAIRLLEYKPVINIMYEHLDAILSYQSNRIPDRLMVLLLKRVDRISNISLKIVNDYILNDKKEVYHAILEDKNFYLMVSAESLSFIVLNLITIKDHAQAYMVLEKDPEIFNALAKFDNIDFITAFNKIYLSEGLATTKTLEMINMMINQASSVEDVTQFFNKLEKIRKSIPCFYPKLGFLASQPAEIWKGEKVSAEWCSVVKTVQNRITALQEKKAERSLR